MLPIPLQNKDSAMTSSSYSFLKRFARVIILCTLFLPFSSCKEEVVPPPAVTKDRVLTMICTERNTATQSCDRPASGVTLIISRVTPDGEEVLATVQADRNGIARHIPQVPTTGMNLSVRAEYNGQVQYSNPRVFLFCTDATLTFCFDREPPVSIDCSTPLDTTMVLPFTDETGKPVLLTGQPLNIGKYVLTKTLFTNTNPSKEMCVTIDARTRAIFHIEQILTTRDVTNDNPIMVRPNESLTLIFSASTAGAGTFSETFVVTAALCNDNSCQPKVFRLNTRATVEQLSCTCPTGRDTLQTLRPDPDMALVTVGMPTTYLNTWMFRVSPDCLNIVVDSAQRIDAIDHGWRISTPLPAVISASDVRLNLTFTPTRAGISSDTLVLYYHFERTMQKCSVRVILLGEACRSMCPLYGMNGSPLQEFSSRAGFYTMRYVNSGIIPFSENPACGGSALDVVSTLTLTLPDTACCTSPTSVRIDLANVDPSGVSSRFFTVQSAGGSVLVSKNSQTRVLVTFRSPTVNEFDRLFTSGERTRTNTVADSTFSIQIRLTSDCNGCSQVITVDARVNTFSQLSPIRNLRAYGQKTDLVRFPSTEVCTIISTTNGTVDPGLVRSLTRSDRSFPYPPNDGDFFVEVADTSVAFPPLPRKEPMLFRVTGTMFTRIQKLASGYPENSVANITPVLTLLQNEVQSNPGYFTQPSLPYTWPPVGGSIRPVPGDVYVLYGDQLWPGRFGQVPCRLALLYIRSRTVGEGEESLNTHHQSGIEFRIIYPVIMY